MGTTLLRAIIERAGFYLLLIGALLAWMFGLVHVGVAPRRDAPRGAVGRTAVVPHSPPVFLHFFDWFRDASWREDRFVDPLDWGALEITDRDRQSESFYYKQFVYIKALGVDAVAWEFHAQKGAPPTYPTPEAVAALKRSGLKIVPFYDLEISFKVRFQPDTKPLPLLSNPGAIRGDLETAEFMADELAQFFSHVPRDLLGVDRRGRLVVFVFGYGFDDSRPDPARWSAFGHELVRRVAKDGSASPTFYWTAKNSTFEEHLFLHDREHFVPFQFVLDTPQSQFGHDAVTWNFGFDNLGVFLEYGLERVIRLDRRYVEEMAWLPEAVDPALVFIYGWNEPFEGSMLLPTRKWGDTKARLAKRLIDGLSREGEPELPKALLIVDDLDALWRERRDDWHLVILRALLLYPMRRFVPQADVRTPAEITPAVLDEYEMIVDLTSKKVDRVSTWLLERMPRRRIMVFDPLGSLNDGRLSAPFVQAIQYRPVNQEVSIVGHPERLFVRDDVQDAVPCRSCAVTLTARIGGPPGGWTAPLVVTRGDDVWVNAYTDNEIVLKAAFEGIYGRPMGTSILYGEGLAAQRLEIEPKTERVRYNRLSRYSVNRGHPIPSDIDWYLLPDGVEPKDFRFVFGLDNN